MSARPKLLKKPRKPTLDVLPNIDDIVIEDGAPVDGIYSEKQMRLLTEPLYSHWDGPGKKRTFLVLANVGLFFSVQDPPIVPDVMLSVDVKAKMLAEKRHNTYFLWEFGKHPEVGIEIVSNRVGEELGSKLLTYARIGLGIDKWEGEFEGINTQWIRWTDDKGRLIPTGAESSRRQRKRAKKANELAKQAEARANKAQAEADRLKSKLRSLGIDPNTP